MRTGSTGLENAVPVAATSRVKAAVMGTVSIASEMMMALGAGHVRVEARTIRDGSSVQNKGEDDEPHIALRVSVSQSSSREAKM